MSIDIDSVNCDNYVHIQKEYKYANLGKREAITQHLTTHWKAYLLTLPLSIFVLPIIPIALSAVGIPLIKRHSAIKQLQSNKKLLIDSIYNKKNTVDSYLKLLNNIPLADINYIVHDLGIRFSDSTTQQLPDNFIEALAQFASQKHEDLATIMYILNIAKYTAVNPQIKYKLYEAVYKIVSSFKTDKELKNLCNKIPSNILGWVCFAYDKQRSIKNDNTQIQPNQLDKIVARSVITKLPNNIIQPVTDFDLQNYAYCLLVLKDERKTITNYKQCIQIILNAVQQSSQLKHQRIDTCCQYLCKTLDIQIDQQHLDISGKLMDKNINTYITKIQEKINSMQYNS